MAFVWRVSRPGSIDGGQGNHSDRFWGHWGSLQSVKKSGLTLCKDGQIIPGINDTKSGIMDEILKQLAIFGISPLIVALLLWAIIETRLKNAIHHEFDVKLKQLEHAQDQDNIKFQKTFPEKADIIKKIYSDLIQLRAGYNEQFNFILLQDDARQEKGMEELNILRQNFNNYFRPNGLFLPKNIALRVMEYVDTLQELWISYTVHSQFMNHALTNPSFYRPLAENQMQKIEKLRVKEQACMNLVHNEFQTELGIKPEDGKK